MSTPQSAIIPDHCRAAIYIEADVNAGNESALRLSCHKALDVLAAMQKAFPDTLLGLTIAFGDTLWKQFGHNNEGGELKPFRVLGNGLAPATQHDVMFHIQSLRADVNFKLAVDVLAAFGDNLNIASETHGLRLLEERGVDGFVDGTENPQGDEDCTTVGSIGGTMADAGGSYVLLQKYQHDLKKWNSISVATQEAAVGRSKQDDEEFEEDVRLPDSHLGRTSLEENGAELEIVRRSMPYGTVSGESGLMFISYSATLYNIEQQLLHMFGEADGKTDLLLTHLSTAVSGAYYYAPSVERLCNL